RNPVGAYLIRSFKQIAPTTLRIPCPLSRHGLLTALQRTLKPVMKLASLRPGEFTDGIEGDTQVGNGLRTLQQLLSGQTRDSLDLLAHPDASRHVTVQTGRVACIFLLAFLKHGIAVLAKLFPEPMILIAGHRAHGPP